MRIPLYRCIALAFLMAPALYASAQSGADQSFKNIPQQTKESAENKATAKTNTVANNALNKLDSTSDKVFKGFTALFKKKDHSKNKQPKTDSTGSHL